MWLIINDLSHRGGFGRRKKGDLKMKVECAGINRQEAEDEKSSRERSSEPLGPEFCAVGREAWSEA